MDVPTSAPLGTSSFSPIRVFAPAKINLYLHVLQKLSNGYHALDSLMSFADIGDEIIISPSPSFQFKVSGPMAGAFSARDLDHGPQSSNLVVKAAWRLARLAERTPNVCVELVKVLPLGAGIGGGSSDAAAVIWGLCGLWDIPRDADFVQELLASLGADVPVCFAACNARIRGVGDVLEDAPALPEMPIVLVYPGKPCSTVDVFQRFNGEMREPIALPRSLSDFRAAIKFLRRTDNALLMASIGVVPEIENILTQMGAHDGCAIARMSGSGSCCFGLFSSESEAMSAASDLSRENPDWWVDTGWLGRGLRY